MPRPGLIQRVLSLPVLLLLVLCGCASLLPAPSQQWVTLKTSTSTRYYSVRGTTTGAIFDQINRNGLFDANGQAAIGQTSAQWTMRWQGIDARPILCTPPPMTIALDLVVTLPRHDQLNDLSDDLKAKWQRFAARIATHEQRHVDIFLDGAKATKARMEATLTKWSSCSELDKTIRSLWASQQAEIQNAQDQFHAEDWAMFDNDRRPLQALIDVNQVRLAAIDSEIRNLDLTGKDLRRRLDATRAKVDGSRSSCLEPRPTSQLRALCQQHNDFVAAHNALVDEHNGVARRRDSLAAEHGRLLAETNGLIDALNWTR